jgi:hypothetical protein
MYRFTDWYNFSETSAIIKFDFTYAWQTENIMPAALQNTIARITNSVSHESIKIIVQGEQCQEGTFIGLSHSVEVGLNCS